MGRRDLLPLVDANAVEMLESLAPKYSTGDAATVRQLMEEGKVFQRFVIRPSVAAY
jgi:hypothetical protein